LVVIEIYFVVVRNLGLWIASYTTCARVAALLVIVTLRRRHRSLLEHVLTSKTRSRMQDMRHSRETRITGSRRAHPRAVAALLYG
jgi:hypothetical protein